MILVVSISTENATKTGLPDVGSVISEAVDATLLAILCHEGSETEQ